MKERLKAKMFKAWSINPMEALAKYGVNRILTVHLPLHIAIYTGNGYRYYMSVKNGKIIKEIKQ